jgi:hypothetical protein
LSADTPVKLGGLLLFIDLDLARANLWGVLAVLMVASLAFMGLGLMAAVLPVMSPEHGAPAANIFQGLLLLVSGVYYPVEVLPTWVQPLAVLSPATYALSASRKLIGIGQSASTPGNMTGASLSAVAPELLVLASGHVDGQTFAPSVQDGFSIPLFVASTGGEGVSEDLDSSSGRDPANKDDPTLREGQMVQIQLTLGRELGEPFAPPVLSDGALTQPGLDVTVVHRHHEPRQFPPQIGGTLEGMLKQQGLKPASDTATP